MVSVKQIIWLVGKRNEFLLYNSDCVTAIHIHLKMVTCIFVRSLIVICFVGSMYTSGEAGKIDLTKAVEYFTMAAEKGK